MIQAKFGHFHRLQKRSSADIYFCVTYIRTVPEFVHSINFFFFFLFFQKNTKQDWVTLMKAHNGTFLGNSVNGSKTICIKTGFHPRIYIISVDNCYLEVQALESPYHLVAVSGAHFTQGTILIVIIVSSGSAKSRTHQSAVGGFLVTRRGWPGRLRACRIWTFINSV